MSPIDLKIKLIEKINEIEDIEFLEAIHTLLDQKTGEHLVLSLNQKESIEISKQQIKEGHFLKSEDVFAELKEWIKRK